jgi:hypothetical protein
MTKWQLDPDSTLAEFEPATFSFEGRLYNHSATNTQISLKFIKLNDPVKM